MSDAPAIPDTPPADAAPPAQDGTDWKAEAEKIKAEARKWEDRAKANSTAAKELEQLRQSAMTDQEKAVAEAKATGRLEALVEAAGKVASAEIKAAAAGRLTDDQVSTLLEGLNLAAFVGEDGEVDAAKVKTFVDGIAPEPKNDTPVFDLGQGARGGGNTALNGDPLLRSVQEKLGIR